MILPTIHLNGTSAEMLLDGYRQAMDAVETAREALGKIEFNARDYYVQGPSAWTEAQASRHEMFVALSKIHEELMAHAMHCNDASWKRIGPAPSSLL